MAISVIERLVTLRSAKVLSSRSEDQGRVWEFHWRDRQIGL